MTDRQNQNPLAKRLWTFVQRQVLPGVLGVATSVAMLGTTGCAGGTNDKPATPKQGTARVVAVTGSAAAQRPAPAPLGSFPKELPYRPLQRN
jgi:hypothetical protein